jgi:hypothetical protein
MSVAIEKLRALDLIDRIDDEDNQNTYYLLTKKGNYFWKEIMLSKTIEFDGVTASVPPIFDGSDLPF